MPAFLHWDGMPPGQHRLPCPSCGRGTRQDRTLGVTVTEDGHGVAHCFRCHYVETRRPSPVRRKGAGVPATTARVPVPAKNETLAPAARALWSDSLPITRGTPAAEYLETRRCVLPPPDGDPRWLPNHRHPSGHRGPCLVALLTDAHTREPRSLDFTWVEGGRKADLATPRLLLRGHVKRNCVCRLWHDEVVTLGLGIAEGLETALSLAHAYTPVWACIDAGNLAQFPVLAGIQALTIACDRDPAGEHAAHACATRWAAAGAEVWVTRQACNDLNDLVQEVRE